MTGVGWVVLLPPSRGIRDGGDGPVWGDTHLWDGPQGTVRRAVIAAARKLRVAELGDAVGAASAASEARRYLQDVHAAPTMSAVERYTGVVYDHLDVGSLGARARRRADEHLGTVSALFGFVRGGDPIPPYRLLMLATLPGIGRVHHAWKPVVADAIADHVAEDGVVVDLLSAEYRAAVGPGLTKQRTVVDVRFTVAGGGRVASYQGKQAKGWLTRHLLAHGTTHSTADDLAATLSDYPHGTLTDRTDTTWTVQLH